MERISKKKKKGDERKMIHPEIYVNLTYNQKVYFAIIILILTGVSIIVTKMKNKPKKVKRQQTICHNIKFDIYEYLMQDFKQEFIGQYKVYKNELKRI